VGAQGGWAPAGRFGGVVYAATGAGKARLEPGAGTLGAIEAITGKYMLFIISADTEL